MSSKERRRIRRQQSSTGPNPPVGNTTHVPTGEQFEHREEYDLALARYTREFNPISEHMLFLVSLLASAFCRLQRIERIEAAALDLLLDPATAGSTIYHRIAAAMGDPACVPDKLLRHRNSAERSYKYAHRELTSGSKIQNEVTPRRQPHPRASSTSESPDIDITDPVARQAIYRNLQSRRPDCDPPSQPPTEQERA